MNEIIERFCEIKEGKPLNENGLLLIDMPTGTGKTYAVIDYIFENYEKIASTGGKIFFITGLKKNLPQKQLRDKFIKAGLEHLYDKEVLFIDSNVDCLIDNFMTIEKDIPYEFKNKELFQSIRKNIQTILDYNKWAKDKNTDLAEDNNYYFAEKAKDDLRENLEPQLRKFIEEILKYDDNGKQRKSENRKKLIVTEQAKYGWIAKIYPAVFTDDKKILMMSLDKFLVRNCTLIKPSYLFYASNLMKNSTVFIDEFDSGKDTILKVNIDNSLKDKIQLVELYRSIADGLTNTEFTRDLLRLSDYSKEKLTELGEKWITPQKIIDNFKKEISDITEKYDLFYLHKLEKDDRESKFIFHDTRYHNIFSDSNKEIIIEKDKEAKVNWLKIVDKTKIDSTKKDNNIYSLLSRIRGFISYFQNGIGMIAYNFFRRRQQEIFDYTYESAVKTVLDEFHLQGRMLNFLVNNIINNQKKNQYNLTDAKTDFDLSIYEKGFRFYDFVNKDDHDTQSKIEFYSYTETPEKFIVKIASRAKIVGVSASATIPTVTGNYDLVYLKSKLGKKYFEIQDIDKVKLNKAFAKHTANYEKINIKLFEIEVNEVNYRDHAIKLFDGETEFADDFLQSKFDARGIKGYDKYRYIRLFLSMQEFLLNKKNKSFLCLMNLKAKKGESSFDYDFINEQFELMKAKYCLKAQMWKLDGSLQEFERKKEKLQSYLKGGSKIFVLSTYQTLGAGQNLQYEIPDGEEDLIQINDDNYGHTEKDFDGIYLDSPTNVFVNLNKDIVDDKEFSKYLYYIMFLQENGELSQKDADEFVKKAFSRNYQSGARNIKTPDCKSVDLHYARIILQAIGRICRTKNKNKQVVVAYDKAITNILGRCKNEFSNRLVNPEFKKLIDSSPDVDYKYRVANVMEQKANVVSSRLYSQIIDMISRPWTFGSKQNWQALRTMVLKYPYLNEVVEGCPLQLYIELEKPQKGYFYKMDADYKDVAISFTEDLKASIVSEKECRLPQLMDIEGVKEYFIENDFVTKFEPAKYIIPPVLFNNIYKGALGEVIGKFIFEKHIINQCKNNVLNEIEQLEKFEKFDYVYEDIYIDFKHWTEATEFTDSEMLQKYTAKLNDCVGKKAIIANIISSNNYEQPYKLATNILVVPYLVRTDNLQVEREICWEVKKFLDEQ